MLRSGSNEQLLGDTANAASGGYISSDRFSQWQITGGVAVLKHLLVVSGPSLRQKSSPEFIWKRVEGGCAGAKRAWWATVVGNADGEEARFVCVAFEMASRGRLFVYTQQVVRELVRDVSAVTDASFEIALGVELFERVQDRVSRDVEFAGEFAR